MPARCPTLMGVLVVALAGCAPGDDVGVASGGAGHGPTLRDSKRTLLDPVRQVYRFNSGVCRELGALPSPWREYSKRRYEKPGPWGRFPPGYDDRAGSDTRATEITLEAGYAQLGVPPANTLPGRIRRSGLSQDVALFSLGPSLGMSPHWVHLTILEALAGAQPNWHVRQPIPVATRWTEPLVYVPVHAPFPVSDRYGVYAQGPSHVSGKSSLVIINPAQRAGVYCDPDYDLRNPSCMGLILLNDEEVATIDVNYEALGRLDEVVASMTHAAHVIRTHCAAAGVMP